MLTKTFATVNGLDLDQAKTQVAFPFRKETLVTEQNQSKTKLSMLYREDYNTQLGLISEKRPIIPHAEAMSWLVDQFTASGVPFKLRESVVTPKGDLYQEYLFDKPIGTPDSTDMSALISAKFSYVAKPIDITFGTYRFICDNGAIVSNTVGRISVSARELGELLKTSLQGEIGQKFDHLMAAVDKYAALNGVSLSASLPNFLKDKLVPLIMKKLVLKLLEEEGNITIGAEKLVKEELEAPTDALYQVVKEGTAWNLYNAATNVTTHKARSVVARQFWSNRVSNFFKV